MFRPDEDDVYEDDWDDPVSDGPHAWRCQGTRSGKAWEARAFVDVARRTIHFSESPVSAAAKPHEGGGGSYALSDFRRGAAGGWRKSQPALYACVCSFVESRWPQ
jgi:hypothetical protein